MDVLKLSSDLMSFKSISPKSAGSLEFIQDLLNQWGFDCHLLEFGESKVKNLYACFTGGKGPNVCFAGHTDVVPPGDEKEWDSEPFTPLVKDGILYGRGASDMKTAIAAFLVSSKKFIDLNKSFNGSISFLLTADEEGDADYGTKTVVEWLGKSNKKIDYCLVGEPTNPNILGEMIKVGRRGSLNGEIIIKGKQGHVAYPEKCKNPIDDLLLVCSSLNEKLDEGSKTFQPSKLTITSIDVGNKVTNLVPNSVKLRFNVRFNDNFKSEEVIKLLKNRLDRLECNYDLQTKVSGESFFNFSEKLTESIVNAVKTVTKNDPELSTSGGTSDARFISKICPVIEFGIVGKTMHQINENISINDIEKLSDIYFLFLKNIFEDNF